MPLSWIYIIAIILFAIGSSVSKTGKTKGRGTPGRGMPTFGGETDGPLRRPRMAPGSEREAEREARTDSGFPAPGRPVSAPVTDGTDMRDGEARPDERHGAPWAFPETASPWMGGPDRETGEGLSVEQAEESAAMDDRTAQMQQELERLHDAFDSLAGAEPRGAARAAAAGESSVQAGNGGHFAHGREELRRGLLWAEILGPPRAKQPYSARKHS